MALNPKQKKRLKIGIIIASIATLLIATPIAAFYAVLYDSSSKDVYVEKDTRTADFLADEITKSLSNLKSDKTISVSVGQDKVNEVLKLLKKKSYEFGRYVTNVEYSKESSELYIDLQIPLFKTRMKVEINPYYDNVEDDFVVEVKNVKMGRLSSITPFVKKLTDNENAIKAFLWLLDTMSLNINFDKENFAFRYPIENIVYDLYASSLEDRGSLIAGFMSQVVTDHKVEASYENRTLKSSVDGYGANEFVIPEYELSWPIEEKIKNYIRPMIQTKKFDAINNYQQNMLLRYLLLGYDNIPEDEQNVIKDLDLTGVGISDITSYRSEAKARLDQKLDLSNIIIEQVEKEVQEHKDEFVKGYQLDIRINEEQFRKALYSSAMLFNGFCPSTNDGSEIHYLLNDNVYINVVKNGLAIVSNFNVEGYDITHSGLFEIKEGKDNVFFLPLIDTRFGDKKACTQSDWSYAILLSSFIQNTAKWIYLDVHNPDGLHQTTKDNYTLVFDFNVPLKETKLREEVEGKGLTYQTKVTFSDNEMILLVDIQ